MKALVTTNTTSKTERVFLIGAQFSSRTAYEVQESLSELAELAKTAGGTVIDTGLQVLEKPHAATFIGSGKAEQFAVDCRSRDIDTVIFDDELSPAQSRNLEEIFKCKILDRTSLILDIFAQRAQTREGKLQVELAMLQHLLPRLTGYWTHLSRQKGGIGMRGGEGETQLEADRRKVQERIDRIRRELDLVQRQRSTRREGRRRNLWPLASIVGYTNAGKSTLVNKMLKNYGITYADKDLANEIGEYTLDEKWVSGTNLCINLNRLKEVPAFYNPPNARGEDTFFSTKLGKAKTIKIPVYHFHDGFLQYTRIMEKDFPLSIGKIKMNSAKIEKRFFNACIGWARYKPLLMYVINKEDYLKNSEIVYNKLKDSVDEMNKLIKYSDCDFTKILEEYKAFSSRVILDFQDYQRVNRIWNKLKRMHIMRTKGFITYNNQNNKYNNNQTMENI